MRRLTTLLPCLRIQDAARTVLCPSSQYVTTLWCNCVHFRCTVTAMEQFHFMHGAQERARGGEVLRRVRLHVKSRLVYIQLLMVNYNARRASRSQGAAPLLCMTGRKAWRRRQLHPT